MTPHSRLIAGLLGVAAAIAVPSASAQALAPDALYARVQPSVWRVVVADAKHQPLAAGSAVVIGPGRLITNCHVLAQAASVSVVRANISFGATLEFPDTERDLCQLKVENFSAPAVTLADAGSLRVGMKVYALGHPRGLETTLSDGLVSALRRDADGRLQFIQTSAPISPGSSGGGLFDAQGRLVGITTLSRPDAQNLNFAIPAALVLDVPARGRAALQARSSSSAAAAAPAPSAGDAPPPPGGRERSAGSGPPGRSEGDWFEYVITDAASGAERAVTLRVDALEGEHVAFNRGTRREGAAGQLLEPMAQDLGELDIVTPPGGWARVQMPGVHRLDFSSPVLGQQARFELTATADEPAPLAVGAGRFEAIRIELSGWHSRVALLSGQARARYKATVWWVPELRRVVRFTMEARTAGGASRPGAFTARESLELVRAIPR